MTSTTFTVSDMHCGACVTKLRNALSDVGAVRTVTANPARRQLFVTHDSAEDVHRIVARIEDAGFHPVVSSLEGSTRQHDLLKRLGVAGLAMMQVMMAAFALYAGEGRSMTPAFERLLELTSLLFAIPVVCYSAVPFYRGAFRGLPSGLNMDVPIALAILIAFSASVYATLAGSGHVYYDSVVMFAFLLLLARYLDDRLRQQFEGEDALLRSLPRIVQVVGPGDVVEERTLDAVEPGMTLLVTEGAQIPVDGELLDTAAELDESVLTGESAPVTRRRGAVLFAGTYNRGAALRMRVDRLPQSSRLADIARLAEQAGMEKPRGARLAERIAAIFVPSILAIALLTYIGWSLVAPEQALSATLAVLVISCPCALSLAMPAAFSAAMVRLRRGGIVLAGSDTLERLGGIGRVLFDKTGTLTLATGQGAGNIVAVACADDWSEALCRRVAAGLERYSTHPLARAFEHPEAEALTAVKVVSGAGVQGTWRGALVRIGSAPFCGAAPGAGETLEGADPSRLVYLSADGAQKAVFHLEELLKPDAQECIARLRQRGLELGIISGDRNAACAALADRLGLDYQAEALPEAKLAAARDLQNAGERVMFVGDGINDIPVLARADVAVSMLDATDLVRSRADVMLLTRRLAALPLLFDVAARTRSVIRQNLLWALGYNLIAIPAAVSGLAPPWFAALGMATSSLLVMANALRLLGVEESAVA
jgi:Cu2+-exporting ATPase